MDILPHLPGSYWKHAEFTLLRVRYPQVSMTDLFPRDGCLIIFQHHHSLRRDEHADQFHRVPGEQC